MGTDQQRQSGTAVSTSGERFATALATFGLVVLGTALQRFGSLFVDQLWLDDIQIFDAARRGLSVDPANDQPPLMSRPYWMAHFWMLRNIQNVVVIRLIYVAAYGAAALLAHHLLAKAVSARTALAVVVASFLNPGTLLVFVFINGSSSVLALLGVLVGLCCLVELFRSPTASYRTWLMQAAFGASCLGVVIVGSNGVLILAAFALLPWWRAPLRTDRRGFLVHVGTSLACVIGSIGLGVAGTLSAHPYSRIPGRVVDGPLEALANLARLLSSIAIAYIDPPLATGGPTGQLVTIGVALTVLLGLAFLLLSALRWMFKLEDGHRVGEVAPSVADYIPFLVAAALASVAGLAFTRIFHLWHLFLPSVFLVASVLLAGHVLFKGLARKGLLVAVFVLTTFSFVQQNERFSVSAAGLSNLAHHMEVAAATWDGVEQVFVFTALPGSGERAVPPPNVGLNAPLRSLAFVRNVTGIEGIDFAFIGGQGRAERIMKTNVEDATRTRLYRYEESGASGEVGLVPTDLRHWGASGISASYGIESKVGVLSLQNFLCDRDAEATWVVGEPDYGWLHGLLGDVEFEAEVLVPTWTDFSVPSGELFWVELLLEASRSSFGPQNAVYSETTPPMPLIGPGIALYQTPKGYDLRSFEGGMLVWDVESPGLVEVFLVGCEGGALALFVDGVFYTFLEPAAISGKWRLGSGYKERTWDGTLNVRMGTFSASAFEAFELAPHSEGSHVGKPG
jgi:hypothetical protein